jgi:predicted ATP-grasp superfamily ATP-dependent carboligase
MPASARGSTRRPPELVSRLRTGEHLGRVLVTEGDQRAALAACRSLSHAGWWVALASARRPAAGHWSRACAARLGTVDPDDSPERFLEQLAALVEEHGCEVVLAGGERSLALISGQRKRFTARLGLPEHELVERSLDKIALLEAAARAKLASPSSRVCTTRADLERAVAELGLPVAIKPSRTVLRSRSRLRQQPIVVVRSRSELDEGWLETPPFIVQRFEESACRLSCAGLMTEDGLRGFVVVRFLRTWPPAAGAVSFGETVPVPPTLPSRVEALLDDIGWRGIFELELLDPGQQRFAAIDLNPRVFGWLELAIAAGVDLPRLWIEWVSGGDPEPAVPRVGVRYRWEDAELAHVARQLRRGNLRAAARVARPRRHVVHAHFRLRDPGPLAGRMLDVARRGLRSA